MNTRTRWAGRGGSLVDMTSPQHWSEDHRERDASVSEDLAAAAEAGSGAPDERRSRERSGRRRESVPLDVMGGFRPTPPGGEVMGHFDPTDPGADMLGGFRPTPAGGEVMGRFAPPPPGSDVMGGFRPTPAGGEVMGRGAPTDDLAEDPADEMSAPSHRRRMARPGRSAPRNPTVRATRRPPT